MEGARNAADGYLHYGIGHPNPCAAFAALFH